MSGFVDTSVIVRYLVRDVPALADRAATVIDGDEEFWVDGVVLTEVDYVLRSVYRVPKEAIIDRLMAFLNRENIDCYGLDKGTVLQALLMCRPSGRVSVADALIWAAARTSGTNVVYSLDRRFPADAIEVRRGL